MADRTEGSITIAASPDRILDEIADVEAYPEWSAEIKLVEVKERAADGRPKQVYFEVAAGPINAKYTLSYTFAPHRVAWTFVEGTPIRDLSGEYVLEPQDANTHVTYRMSLDAGIPLPSFVKRQGEKRIIDTALKGLKRRVEAT